MKELVFKERELKEELILKEIELEQEVTQAINKAKLPAFVVRLILDNLLAKIIPAEQEQYIQAKNNKKKKDKPKVGGKNDKLERWNKNK